jgi:hypothetical protein
MPGSARDDYFWTEVTGLTVKIVGRLPLLGEPATAQGSVADGRALLTWSPADGTSTAVAYGLRKPVAARPPPRCHLHRHRDGDVDGVLVCGAPG